MKINSIIPNETGNEFTIQTGLSEYTVWEEDGEVIITARGLRKVIDTLEFPNDDLLPIALYMVAELEASVYGL